MGTWMRVRLAGAAQISAPRRQGQSFLSALLRRSGAAALHPATHPALALVPSPCCFLPPLLLQLVNLSCESEAAPQRMMHWNLEVLELHRVLATAGTAQA